MAKALRLLKEVSNSSIVAPIRLDMSLAPSVSKAHITSLKFGMPGFFVFRECMKDIIPYSSELEAPVSQRTLLVRMISSSLNRLILFNKCDLISKSQTEVIQRYFEKDGHEVAMTNALEPKTLRKIISRIQKTAKPKFQSVPTACMVLGFPNVGKSSIINALRRAAPKKDPKENFNVSTCEKIRKFGAGARVGANPGVTRSNQGFMVSFQPPIFLVDSPGIMAKNFVTSEEKIQGMRLAAVGCIREHTIGNQGVARFLHHQLLDCDVADSGRKKYFKALGLNESKSEFEDVLTYLLHEEGLTNASPSNLKAGEIELASRKLLKLFRTGKLGHFVLDGLH